MSAGPPAPPVDAVTVIVVRDRPATAPGTAIEVLLLERHPASPFAPGALVFPGGKIDPEDAVLADGRWQLHDPGLWRQRLGVDDDRQAVAMLVAAVRECFEESGLLFARRSDGSPVVPRELTDGDEVRAAMAARDRRYDWRDWLDRHDLVLDLERFSMWSWWLTPRGRPRRYDTRFLITLAPEGQTATQDDVELTALRWSPPRDVLTAADQGAAHLIRPTRATLVELDRYADTASVLADARGGSRDLRRYEPPPIARPS